MHRRLRCGAQTRTGYPCRSPAVRGKRRCRMHGGAPRSGAPIGNKNALRHGHYTAEAIAWRRGLADVPPPLQAELRDARSSGNGGEHHERKPPKIKVKSTPGKSLKIDMQPIDAVRLLSAFGTADPSVKRGVAARYMRRVEQLVPRRPLRAGPEPCGQPTPTSW
jgi:hypothetical protein